MDLISWVNLKLNVIGCSTSFFFTVSFTYNLWCSCCQIQYSLILLSVQFDIISLILSIFQQKFICKLSITVPHLQYDLQSNSLNKSSDAIQTALKINNPLVPDAGIFLKFVQSLNWTRQSEHSFTLLSTLPFVLLSADRNNTHRSNVLEFPSISVHFCQKLSRNA